MKQEEDSKDTETKKARSKETKPKEKKTKETNSREAKPKETNLKKAGTKEAGTKKTKLKETKLKETVPRETEPGISGSGRSGSEDAVYGKKKTAELQIPDLNGTALSASMHLGNGIRSPFMKEIHLTRQAIVGTRYVGGFEEIVRCLKPGDRITFLREPDNRFDPLAIMALDPQERKLGYIPRHDNAILAALMDAGKYFFGIVPEDFESIRQEFRYTLMVDLYMREFALPDDLTEIPRQGFRGSYAVVDLTYTTASKGFRISEIFAIKVINGEERETFSWSEAIKSTKKAERKENRGYREMLDSFHEFAGYLPLVGHDLKIVTGILGEAFGVMLGIPFSNRIIDTERMAVHHLPWAEVRTLDELTRRLGIEAYGLTEAEKRCRSVWQLYCRMERSELDRKT